MSEIEGLKDTTLKEKKRSPSPQTWTDKRNLDVVDCIRQETQQDSSLDSEDDYEGLLVPPEIHEQIRTYIENELVPDIKSYVKDKYPKIWGVPIEHISMERLRFFDGPFKLIFNVEQHYNLYQMAELLKLKNGGKFKVMASESVAAAIRISKDIKKEKHADRITEIVNNSFTLDEHPDLTDEMRRWFFGYYKG